MSRRGALGLYLALIIPFGIGVHLASEFAGLGRAAMAVAISPLHAYLGLLAVLSAVALTWFGYRAGDLRRRLPLLIRALPFEGRGAGFFAFGAACQFGFFLVTQFGEGDPLRGGDLLVGILVAVLGSLLGSLVLTLGGMRAMAWSASCTHARRDDVRRSVPAAPLRGALLASPYFAFVPVRGNRPPPYQTVR
ncbi:MAG TPA: hypothetical protein VIG46_12545 [Candidatus Baltobacteraceae bacterium]|jgi:hypothetical protein